MKCQHCNTAFECRADISCWCGSLPKLISLKPSVQTCLCRSCLIRELAEHVNRNVAHLESEDVKRIAEMGVPEVLEEGVDYNINKKGLYEFSAWYLLRRSYCCDNNCKNCPYKKLTR